MYSDVLYYLSPREISRVLTATREIVGEQGVLVFANEWAGHYRHMTSPDEVVELIEFSGDWCLLHYDRAITGADSSLTVACFRRQAV